MNKSTFKYERLSQGQCIKHLELRGYVIFPTLISSDLISKIKFELRNLPTQTSSYSQQQKFIHNVQWTDCKSAIELVALPAML
ncbi:MAG: hypothetical protein GDA56_15670 [Hormoscilla sp. GM7CHS1pb]|nr:hypothetical protein [Hormoscilla sp. GM7CHS1pb]